MTAEPLLERDVERAFALVVPHWQLERLDTRWGTDECARYLRSYNQMLGCTTHAYDDDGNELPYGGSQESWCFKVEARGKTIEVKVEHHDAYDGPEWSLEGLDEWLTASRERTTVERAGVVSWNRFANMATVAACAVQRANGRDVSPREPEVGEQIALL